MPQEFLHNFEFRPYASQQGRVCVAERVPANPLIDPESFCNGSNNPAEDRLSQVRMAAAMVLIGKHPVMLALTPDDASLLHRILLHRGGGAIGFSLLSVLDYRFAQAVM
jgi:hypothetical protein